MQQLPGIASDFSGAVHPHEEVCGVLPSANLAGEQAARSSSEMAVMGGACVGRKISKDHHVTSYSAHTHTHIYIYIYIYILYMYHFQPAATSDLLKKTVLG